MDSLNVITTPKLHNVHVPQKFIRAGPTQKPMMLIKEIKEKVKKGHKMIIFTNSSKTCDWLTHFLHDFDIENERLHGNMNFDIRRGKFGSFKSGEVPVLITTNAGSRGLDTIDVRYVVNYEFPLQTAEYIHR